MNEKLYLFNPFETKKATNNELRVIYNEVFKELIKEPNTMYEYSHNIEVYSNLNYIIGEIIARLTRDVIELKTDIQINSAIQCVEERKNWNIEKDGKQPAMSYFEALGIRFCKEKIQLQAKKEEDLRRFKNAYASMEEKINSLKKKQDAIKYEEIGN
jgi:hypothetical protein